MAPEQVTRDRAIGTAADIFAFGVVLFEMITGQRPYEGETGVTARIDRAAPSRRGLPTIALLGEWSWLALVFIASCAALAAGTYNPFIYFRF